MREKTHLKTCEVKQAESELDKKLWQLAIYIENSAKGNTEIIKSAGLDVRADPKPLGVPGRVTITSVRETGSPGEIKLIWDKVHGARVYNVELSGKPICAGRCMTPRQGPGQQLNTSKAVHSTGSGFRL